MNIKSWVKLPSRWILDNGLQAFRWESSSGANKIAAIMSLVAIAHHADENGLSRLTYDELGDLTGVSRAKLSQGLRFLEEQALIERGQYGQSKYKLANYGAADVWAKLPAKKLYSHRGIESFYSCHLRNRTELDALQTYLLILSFRDRGTSLAKLSYEKITEYTGVARRFIKPALNFLIVNDLINVEQLQSQLSEHGASNAYRPRHLGCYSRALDE